MAHKKAPAPKSKKSATKKNGGPKKAVAKKNNSKKAAQKPKKAAAKKTAKKKTVEKKKPTAKKNTAPKPIAAKKAAPIKNAAPPTKQPNVIIGHKRLEKRSHVTSYQPETYRSILDEPQLIKGPVYRYGDEELAEFREIINSKIEAARKEIAYLQGLITGDDQEHAIERPNDMNNGDSSSNSMEKEHLHQLAARQIQFISHLEKALIRIENKTYGVCRVTGKLIDKARLRAVPHATLSIEAKKMTESRQN